MERKIGDEVFHKAESNVKLVVIETGKDETGRWIKCRYYNERKKDFNEKKFREEELESAEELLKTPEEAVKYWKDLIAVAQNELEGVEELVKAKSK